MALKETAAVQPNKIRHLRFLGKVSSITRRPLHRGSPFFYYFKTQNASKTVFQNMIFASRRISYFVK